MNPEFVITRYDVPGVWENYISNDEYCVVITPTGRGVGFHRHLAYFQVTAGGRAVYLRDQKDGRAWSLATEPPHPGRAGIHEDLHPLVLSQDHLRAGGDPFVPVAAAGLGFDAFECRHRAGSTRICSVFHGVRAVFEVLVPVAGAGELWRVEIENVSARRRVLAVMPTVGLVLGGGTAMLGNYPTFNTLDVNVAAGTLSAANLGIRYWGLPNLHATLAAGERPDAILTTRDAAHRAVTAGEWPGSRSDSGTSSDHGTGEAIQALFVHRVELAPGARRAFTWALAAGFDPGPARERASRWVAKGAYERAESEVAAWWSSLLDRMVMVIPDAAMGEFANGWLQAEVVQCARWTRGGGERGYRDVLQDAWALAPLRPDAARAMIVEALRHQYASGFAPRSYAPIDGPPPGARRAADSALWIPFALEGYVKETGDLALLEDALPFMDAPEGESALLHAVRAVRASFSDRGERGLPRFREGDWNDGLDGAGVLGRGESVWLGMCLALAAESVARLADALEEREGASDARALAAEARDIAAAVRGAVERHGWDGEWYLQGWNDRGDAMGSRTSPEGRIFLLPQAWALLGEFGDDERRARLAAAVRRDLATPIGPRLLHPAYTRRDPGIGRATARVPGTSDNAGIQTHAAVMMAAGYLAAGHAEAAWETLTSVTPMNPARERAIRATPPFVLNSQTIGPENARFGQTEIGWLTGSAGWMLRTIAERVIGVRPGLDGLAIDPCVPAGWTRFGMRRLFRGARYEIEFEVAGGEVGREVESAGARSPVREVLVNGRAIRGTVVPFAAPGETARVKVILQPRA